MMLPTEWFPDWTGSFFAGDIFAMAGGPPFGLQCTRALEKTKLCKFYDSGRCKLGLACTFAHGRHQLRPQPRLFRTQLCSGFVAAGGCRYGEECRFAHSLEEVRPVEAAVEDPMADASLAEPGATNEACLEALLEALQGGDDAWEAPRSMCGELQSLRPLGRHRAAENGTDDERAVEAGWVDDGSGQERSGVGKVSVFG